MKAPRRGALGVEFIALDQLPEIAWTATPDGRSLRFNAEWTRYTDAPAELTADEVLESIHPADRERTRAAWRESVRNGRPYVLENRIRRHDGAYRWFKERALVVRDQTGAITGFVGISSDVHDERRSRDRLEFLLSITALGGQTNDARSAIAALLELIVPRFADACAIDLFRDDGSFEAVFVAGDDERKSALLRLRELYQAAPPIDNSAWGAARTGTPVIAPLVDEEATTADTLSEEHLELKRRVGVRSGARLPMVAGGKTVGVLTLVRGSLEEPYERGDLPFYTDVASRVARIIERARSQRELIASEARYRVVARTLQSSFLPETLPDSQQVAFSAVYASGASESEIGGDWYDAFELADGTFCFSIGDVGGRGLAAAIPMGKLRQAVRVLSAIESDPARLLGIADAAVRREHPDVYVTAFVAIYDPRTQKLRYANAGHPSPLIRSAEALIRKFPAPDLPLGLESFGMLRTYEEQLRRGDLLVCFTDGLIEAQKDIAAGMSVLMGIMLDPALAVANDAAELVQALALPAGGRDDVAILTLRVSGGAAWSFDASSAEEAQKVREAFVARLHRVGASETEASAAEIVFGELVGNAARYTPGPVDVGLSRDDRGIVLDIIDRGPGFAARGRLPLDPLSESGRGLFLIATLGRALDVRPIEGFGTHVRVRLPLG